MISKEAYRQKIEVQLEMTERKLKDLYAVPGARIKYERQLCDLEYMVGDMKARLRKIHENGEDSQPDITSEMDKTELLDITIKEKSYENYFHKK